MKSIVIPVLFVAESLFFILAQAGETREKRTFLCTSCELHVSVRVANMRAFLSLLLGLSSTPKRRITATRPSFPPLRNVRGHSPNAVQVLQSVHLLSSDRAASYGWGALAGDARRCGMGFLVLLPMRCVYEECPSFMRQTPSEW